MRKRGRPASSPPWSPATAGRIRAALERGDLPAAVAGRQSEVSQQAAAADQAIGAARADAARIEEGIAQAKGLRAEEKALRETAETAKQLAGLLRADRFQAYIKRAALKTLAEDASRHLSLISENRYELALEETPEGRDSAYRRESQEFVVVDHWGELDRRSVKTLSGGETFLASLSLALALAERLPELGAATRPTRLDSLFLDEGFGTLDEASLEAVADALDRLHLEGNGPSGSGRMIGVITHRPELAERMPSRIRVIKSQDGSRVEQD
jgi:exonuclease SbcC